MKKKYNGVDVVFLLDRSGSMAGIEDDTIGGYNAYLDTQKDNDVRVTTVLFDDRYEMLTNRVHINDIEKLDSRDYYVRGGTALLDAIGKTINYMDSLDAKKVIFIITTDGMENSSVEFNKAAINRLINKHSKWEFMYIGANVDSYAEAGSLGIREGNIANYRKDSEGVSKLFSSVSRATRSYCYDEDIEPDWKEELDEYFDKLKVKPKK